MKKDTIIIILGLLVAFVAFFDGVPQVWEKAIIVTGGLLVAFFGYVVRRDRGRQQGGHDTFVETQNSDTPTSNADDIAVKTHNEHDTRAEQHSNT